MGKELFLGDCKIVTENGKITGGFLDIDGETYYRIANFNQMDPFFMTIVSNSDHWMFILSNGGLTAGRKNPDNALFPYYTVDKLQDSAEITGSKTILHVTIGNTTYLWEPFSDRLSGIYKIQRNIYKNIYGNKLLFEEINEDLGIVFSYQWMNSDKYGFIKKSVLKNKRETAISVSVLDGIQNICPSGVSRMQQLSYSNLVDAYRKSELIDQHIALYMLSSIIIDKAEPSEALNTTVVWSEGLDNPKVLLSSSQLNSIRKGNVPETENDIRAARGAYFIYEDIDLTPGHQKVWYIVAEVNKNAGYIASLRHFKSSNNNIIQQLQEDVNFGTSELIKILSAADGLQISSDRLSVYRHLSNVFFNVMRGGIFYDGYNISKPELLMFIRNANCNVYDKKRSFLEALEPTILYHSLLNSADSECDADLLRLCYEYLPLVLSRRHGDPSRPWNLFSIDIKKEDGSSDMNYQGNWRDIFQNWEALSLSYPTFVESMICKFLNASTADGYNPYRITRNGIDWESPDPHDPWAAIGYWGDHQVIYLQKLFEISHRYHPDVLKKMLSEKIFAYADVPYRIKTYKDIVKNPFVTIDFDYEAEKITLAKVKKTGSDGKLIWEKNGEVMHVNFTEKILVTVLAKLSNFIPEAGIWLNTQRPEWNDANNALVGNGVSMVTLYYLRRLMSFCKNLFSETTEKEFEVSEEIEVFFKLIFDTFIRYESLLITDISDKERKLILDDLGTAASDYREKIYKKGFSTRKQIISVTSLSDFFSIALKYTDHTIRGNRRPDGLYHSYNLVTINEDSVSIRHLYEMLEGQVAVLSSGILDAGEVNLVLDALKKSAMFRADQYSYMLYPDRQLARFTEKNVIPAALIESSELLSQLVADNYATIVYKDIYGLYHFNSNFRNASDLNQALDLLQSASKLTQSGKKQVLEVFEKVFDHQSFTGRSGTFYGYEGLGCIYWHMVSKLLLAINEIYFSALDNNADKIQLGKLVEHYYEVRAGIGLNKSPEVYGAFPTDAYSHTPGKGGAKQPGMTGQVKEDIISRFGELGIIIENGQITIKPGLLRKSEFLTEPVYYHFVSVNKRNVTISLTENCLAFTFCQVPFIYHISQHDSLKVTNTDGAMKETEGLKIDILSSNEIFDRAGRVKQVDVYLHPWL
jgi:hypothetical protein